MYIQAQLFVRQKQARANRDQNANKQLKSDKLLVWPKRNKEEVMKKVCHGDHQTQN